MKSMPTNPCREKKSCEMRIKCSRMKGKQIIEADEKKRREFKESRSNDKSTLGKQAKSVSGNERLRNTGSKAEQRYVKQTDIRAVKEYRTEQKILRREDIYRTYHNKPHISLNSEIHRFRLICLLRMYAPLELTSSSLLQMCLFLWSRCLCAFKTTRRNTFCSGRINGASEQESAVHV